MFVLNAALGKNSFMQHILAAVGKVFLVVFSLSKKG